MVVVGGLQMVGKEDVGKWNGDQGQINHKKEREKKQKIKRPEDVN